MPEINGANADPKNKDGKFESDKDSKKKGGYYGSKDPKESRKDSKGSNGDKRSRPRLRSNDPSWHYTSKEVIDNLANLNFGIPKGIGIKLSSSQETDFTLPGITVINVVPTIGKCSSQSSPANIAAMRLFTAVRSKQSSTAPYEPADLLMTTLAVGQVFAVYSHIYRCLAAAQTFKTDNRYAPAALAAACGFDFDDATKRLAEYRAKVNQLAANINSLYVPSLFNLFKRWAYMFANVYEVDSSKGKSQWVMYAPECFYKLDTTKYKTGTALVPVLPRHSTKQNTVSSTPYPSITLYTIDDMITVANSMVSAIALDASANIMLGDMQKKFGESEQITVAAFPDNAALSIIEDADILRAIHNTTLHGVFVAKDECYDQTKYGAGTSGRAPFPCDISQDPEKGIVCDPVIATPVPPRVMDAMIFDTSKDNTSPIDVQYYTRNMNFGERSQPTGSVWRSTFMFKLGSTDVRTHPYGEKLLDSFAAEIPTFAECIYYEWNDAGNRVFKRSCFHSELTCYKSYSKNSWGLTSQETLYLLKFLENNWASPLILISESDDETGFTGSGTTGLANGKFKFQASDYDHYALITPTVMRNLDTEDMMALFNVQSLYSSFLGSKSYDSKKG